MIDFDDRQYHRALSTIYEWDARRERRARRERLALPAFADADAGLPPSSSDPDYIAAYLNRREENE